jgi:hypothetical protein
MKAAEVMVSAVISTRPNGQEQLKHREERFFIGLRNRRENEILPPVSTSPLFPCAARKC